MADRDGGGGGDGRRQRGGEDEAGRIGAHRVDHRGVAGDVAAERAERLGERALDDVDPVGEAFALGDAAAARAVHADGMDLVDIGHGIVFFGEVGDFPDRRDVAVHRIDALEHDQLGPLAPGRGEHAFEMGDVVVAEDLLFRAGAAHALDHRGVVQLVRNDQAIRQQPGDGRDRRLVGDEAGGEHQRRLLAVQVGKFELKLDQRMVGAGNVARAAGARAHAARRLLERGDHVRVLAHAEIVVGAPDGDFLGACRWRARSRAGNEPAMRSRSAKTR